MTECVVSEDGMREAAGLFAERSRSLSVRIETIMDQQAALLTGWSGDAATAYAEFMGRWRASTAELTASVESVADAVRLMADNLRATEEATTRAWPT